MNINRGATNIPPTKPTRWIEPSSRFPTLNPIELWEYRECIIVLTWRDIIARYKQTLVGAAWAIIQPVIAMVIFTLLFSNISELGEEGVPYQVFTFVALVPWAFFSNNIINSANSIVINLDMVTKVYFPRPILPIAAILSSLVDFMLAFVVLLVLLWYYGYPPTWRMIWFVPLVLLTIIVSLGAGFWLSSLNVLFRDVGHATPFLVQIWFFITPIVYSTNALSEQMQLLISLNPMTGIVQGFRWMLLGLDPNDDINFAVSIGITLILFFSGYYFFRATEDHFADWH